MIHLQLSLQTQSQNRQIYSCAFTGHRVLEDKHLDKALKNEIEGMIKQGVTTFYNGGAIGFDLLAAETVLKLKKKHRDLRLIVCIPCYNQERNFSEKDKKRYASVLNKADEKILVSEAYFNGCMQKRDRYMADRADALIAYLKKEVGGTAYTVKYFQKKYPEKPVVFL